MYDELTLSLKKTAYNMLDALYAFLAAGISGTPPDWYAAWSEGPGFSDYVQFFVNSAAILSQYTPVNGSRWIYTQMKSHINSAEGFYARDFIGAPFFDDLKEKFGEDDLSDQEQVAVDYLQPIISMMAYSMAIRDPNIRQEITVIQGSHLDGIPATGSNRADVDNRAAFDRVADQYAARAGQTMDLLRTYLNATATAEIFPLYFNSPLYHNPNDQQHIERHDNRGKKTFFLT